MSNDTIQAVTQNPESGNDGPTPSRELSPAARRALAEAEERRRLLARQACPAEKEVGGRGGADPARFGDWEINGRAIDF